MSLIKYCILKAISFLMFVWFLFVSEHHAEPLTQTLQKLTWTSSPAQTYPFQLHLHMPDTGCLRLSQLPIGLLGSRAWDLGVLASWLVNSLIGKSIRTQTSHKASCNQGVVFLAFFFTLRCGEWSQPIQCHIGILRFHNKPTRLKMMFTDGLVVKRQKGGYRRKNMREKLKNQ